MFGMRKKRAALQAMGLAALGAVLWCGAPVAPVHAADPVKVGLSLALTGGVAANGKQLLAALEIWRDPYAKARTQ